VRAILLRVNAKEKEGKKLKKINDGFLNALSDVQNSVNAAQYDVAATQCGTLIENAKPLLKEEWKRVKAGELSYRLIKYLSIALFVAALLSAICIVDGKSHNFSKSVHSNADVSTNSK
jgi:hypothetical protein